MKGKSLDLSRALERQVVSGAKELIGELLVSVRFPMEPKETFASMVCFTEERMRLLGKRWFGFRQLCEFACANEYGGIFQTSEDAMGWLNLAIREGVFTKREVSRYGGNGRVTLVSLSPKHEWVGRPKEEADR